MRDPSGRALAARMRSEATVQRFVYRREEVDEGAWGASGKFGVGLGYDHLAAVTRRELIAAEILDREIGGRRQDCVPDATT